MRPKARGPGMGGGIDRTQRRIQALYATGPLGALGDAELLGRFAAGEGLDREDAFAALVRRHGPMVLSTCRRMLAGDRDGAEDAFQAVFLVLARKAGSLRRPDDLRPWLYGVAVKAGKEARRRAGRIRAREGGAIIDAPAPRADADLFDLRAAIDEELERLPGRYRDPILLCELEGASRRDAAERLGLAEGTLSSRLARGRSLLRDRLTRRGLAVGTFGAALPPTARAAGLDTLADASVRFVLASPSLHGPPGTASAAVAIAEGVLAMLTAAKLKALTIAAAAALGLLVVTAGFAWGLSGLALEFMPPPVVVHEPDPSARPYRIRGVVVDEGGRPVAGADVRLNAYWPTEVRTTTGPDGSYAMDAAPGQLLGRTILARTPDGRKQGFFQYMGAMIRTAGETPARIVVKPGREVVVRVADEAGGPIAGALVEVSGDASIVAHETTDAEGVARPIVPAGAAARWIFAKKPTLGIDFVGLSEVREFYNGKNEELPKTVALTLESQPRIVRLRAQDEHGDPAVGVVFYAPQISKEGRRNPMPGWSRALTARTGPDGVAVFDWLPNPTAVWMFLPEPSQGYASRRVEVEPNQVEPVVVRLERTVAIRGRATLPDSAPARDVRIQAMGSGWGMDLGADMTRTDDDGRYTMNVPPGEAYVVWACDEKYDAEPKVGLIARPRSTLEGIDFRLVEGTVLHGDVTVGLDNGPLTGGTVEITQEFGLPPAEVRRGEVNWYIDRPLSRHLNTNTNGDGRYKAHLVPGTYKVRAPGEENAREVVVTGQEEVALDLHLERTLVGRLSGRVVDPQGKPVADARVEIAAVYGGVRAFEVRTDAEGRYTTSRRLVPTSVCAVGPDGSLGGAVEIGPDAAEADVTLAPTATASGRIVDPLGLPLRGGKVGIARRSPQVTGINFNDLGNEVVADDEGRITLPALVVGQEYSIVVKRGVPVHWKAQVKPTGPGPLDLGTLQVLDETPGRPTPFFRGDAPDVGAVAPTFVATTLDDKPLTLSDFAGKFVLVDFGATWSRPWLDEDLPALRATHDAFANDGRLAIVTLIGGESADDLRKLREDRKIPWTVGRLAGDLLTGPNAAYGVNALPAAFLIRPDGKVVDRGMRGEEIREVVARAIGEKP